MTYSTLREKISAEKLEREQRYARFASLWDEAWQAGVKAAMAVTPRPMIVMDQDGKPVDYVSEGPCGFAWLNVPGNTSFGKWLQKQGIARPDYPKGLSVWISAYEQSYTRKAAHARAMADVLKANGIECGARSRLD